MTIFIKGFLLSLGLIVAIGAQNAWVLGMSIRRIHPWLIAFVCMTLDALLMAVGVMSFKQISVWLPGIVPWLTATGILMLLWLAFQALRRAIGGQSGLEANAEAKTVTAAQAVGTALAISLLNPHVYLDTVVLVGSLATTSASPWLFWTGAATGSAVWFLSLAALGIPLRRWLRSPNRWRCFDAGLFVVMSWMAFGLWHGL